jgi:hypothetical protein
MYKAQYHYHNRMILYNTMIHFGVKILTLAAKEGKYLKRKQYEIKNMQARAIMDGVPKINFFSFILRLLLYLRLQYYLI